jgi:hypothetical protein
MKPRATAGPRKKVRAASPASGAETAKVGSSGQSETDVVDGVQTRIALLAYQLYEQRGCKDGHDVEDWIQAERTVLADVPAGSINRQL